jgi:Domain of unknown function (DUF397)
VRPVDQRGFAVSPESPRIIAVPGERRVVPLAAQPTEFRSLVWRKSRASVGNGECVEVAFADRSVLVRDSRDETGTILAVTPASWESFVACIAKGELES